MKYRKIEVFKAKTGEKTKVNVPIEFFENDKISLEGIDYLQKRHYLYFEFFEI